jgi:hypothetical protein
MARSSIDIQYLQRLKTYLDERLNLVSPCQSLCAHALRHLSRVALDTSDDRVRVGALLGALIVLLDDDDLFAGLAALEGDGDFSGLVDCGELSVGDVRDDEETTRTLTLDHLEGVGECWAGGLLCLTTSRIYSLVRQLLTTSATCGAFSHCLCHYDCTVLDVHVT